MIRRVLLAAACLLCGGAGIFPARAGSPFFVESWDNEKGLPECAVVSVVQTRDGYLWLATLNGLARFDGNAFTWFNVNNTPGLPDNRIVFLFEDSRTNLWVDTAGAGLCLIKNGVAQNFDATRAAGKIDFADEDESGTVWFCTGGGKVFSCHDGKLDLHPAGFPPQLFYRVFHLRVPCGNGVTWQLQGGRVEKLRDEKIAQDFGASPWQSLLIPAQLPMPDGSSLQIPPFDLNITAACADRDGNLAVGTRSDGIYWFDANGKTRHISPGEGLSSPFVLSLCFDREGNLWAGTDGGGLNRIKRKIFDTPEIHAWTVRSLAEDTNGGIWTAFNGAGLSYFRTNAVRDFGIGHASNAWSVLLDDQQRVWAGTSTEGLFQFQSGSFIPAVGSAALGPWIHALFQDRNGQLWAGTQNGLARRDGQDWKLFTTRDGLSDNVVTAIAADADGHLWAGTENSGLNLFKDGKFTSCQQSENGPPGNDISCLFVDQDNVLWVGTAGHGLGRFQNGQWKSFSSRDGLASDSISYVIEGGQDGQDALWIGCNMGLMRIPKKSLDDFAAGNSKPGAIPCRTYGMADGLPTRECSIGSQPAAIRANDGKLWFPTVKGAAVVNPAQVKINPQPPLVVIESALVDGQEQKTNRFSSAWSRSLTIPAGSEQLEIHYTGLNFSAPELVRFKYWLEGHETRPTEAQNVRVAIYNKLPPGNYRFHVQACNEDGVWSDPDAMVLAVTVQPQFWQTWSFRIIFIAAVLGMVAAIVRFVSTQKLRRQLQAHRQREALEHERARIARDLHDQLGANLTQVTLLGELAEADKNAPAEIELHAQQICQTARETTRALDEIVWAVNPSNDTLEGLMNYACKYAQDYFALAGLRYRVDVPAQLPAAPIPPEVRHNVFLAFKEAVNNVVKHAQATEARVTMRLSPEKFILSVTDNGRGPGDLAGKPLRNGLKNMRKRLADVHGEFEIAPGDGGGTVVKLTVPISKPSS